MTDILDKLLYHLDETRQIDFPKMQLSLIGLGFGGFLLQTFVVFSKGLFRNLDRLILINSFSRIDDNLKSVLEKSKDTLLGCPEHLTELPYKFFSILMNSVDLVDEQLAIKMLLNPIQRLGRLAVIDTFQNSEYIKDRFMAIDCRLDAYHSSDNCAININHLEEVTLAPNLSLPRNKYIINGRHSLIDDDQQELRRIL